MRVLSEVRLPSNPRPAIPIASPRFFAGGGRSIAISRSAPRSSPTSLGSCSTVASRTSKPLPAPRSVVASNPGSISADADSARSSTAAARTGRFTATRRPAGRSAS